MPDFDELEARLREHRYRATDLELDQIKQRAIARASRSRTTGVGILRTRFITLLVVVGLMGAGTGGVIAASSGGGSSQSAAASQYFSCKDLVKANRRDEKSKRKAHRAGERQIRNNRTRQRVHRINVRDEKREKRQHRADERRCRRNNR